MAKTGSTGLSIFTATGKADDGSPFSATYDATVPDGATVNITSGNAGFMAQAWIGADFLEGGNLELTGKFTKDGSPAEFDIALTDVRMRNAPFLTQILSLASLRGLADTLGGEGVLFSRIDVPLKLANGRYVVTGAKAQGPALGLTTSGFIQGDDGTIEFNGVLVPSFGMNSALGGIPIIGDLVVGRDGEGVFSLTYAVSGTLEKANVSVNPLSALAPGVIRRIFENPSDTKIPEAKPRLPDEPIPSELPPIPEESFE
ncbi:MAG: AsmA-like C-terminal domain-containing protein [Pseudomonadota bacterium]